VGVEEDSVDIIVELSGDILGEELHLVDEVAALSTLGGGGSLGLLVPDLDCIGGISGLNSGNVEAGSEGVVAKIRRVEEIVEGGGLETSVLSVDLGKDNGDHANITLEGGSLSRSVVGNLGEGSGELGAVDEGQNVRVVLEHEDLLGGGLVEGSRSDSNNGSGSHVGELQLEGKSEEGFSGVVSELEFVGVLVELEDLEDLGDNVEVAGGLGSLLEVGGVVTSNV
jgi:hypothetical protein